MAYLYIYRHENIESLQNTPLGDIIEYGGMVKTYRDKVNQ